MKIGYPCINQSLGCTPNRTFRLASYSNERLVETVEENLNCLEKTLKFNQKHNLLFFRIGSSLVPFASHPICQFPWQEYFRSRFAQIGQFITSNNFRICMHPDQFVLINARDKNIVQRSIQELIYHCQVLDLLGLDQTAKVQLHIGGVYGDKKSAIKKFITEYDNLPDLVKKRLVVENDHRNYSPKDCLLLSEKINIPVVFDSFHHHCLNNGEATGEALQETARTWAPKDGLLMVDYSSQKPNSSLGSHAESIDLGDFQNFLLAGSGLDFDIMLEIKDKEKSALKALKYLK